MRFTRILAALVVVSALTGTALAASGSNAVVKVRMTSLGSTLVASNGKTLYLFAHDTSTKHVHRMCGRTGRRCSRWASRRPAGRSRCAAGTTKRAGGSCR